MALNKLGAKSCKQRIWLLRFRFCHALAQRDDEINDLWNARTSITIGCGFLGILKSSVSRQESFCAWNSLLRIVIMRILLFMSAHSTVGPLDADMGKSSRLVYEFFRLLKQGFALTNRLYCSPNHPSQTSTFPRNLHLKPSCRERAAPFNTKKSLRCMRSK